MSILYPEVEAKGERVEGVHPTSGLAGFEAIDFFAPPGTPVVAPEPGRILGDQSGYRAPHVIPWDQGARIGGGTAYFQGLSGTVYFLTHLGAVAPAGNYGAGQQLGTVGAVPGGWWEPHAHIGTKGPITVSTLAAAPKEATVGAGPPLITTPTPDQAKATGGSVIGDIGRGLLTGVETSVQLVTGGPLSPFPGAIPGVHWLSGPGTLISDALDVGKFLGKLADPNFWVRVLEIIGGAVLAFTGLYLLAKQIGLAERVSETVPAPVRGAVAAKALA